MFTEQEELSISTITSLVKGTHPTISMRVAEANAEQIVLTYLEPEFCVGNSGGKDSAVVTHIANFHLGLGLPVAHTSKTKGFNAIHPSTLNYLYSRPFPIELYPEGTNFPYKGQIDGTRADESERMDKSNDLIVDGAAINRKGMKPYNACGLFGIKFIYPIFDWNNEMVWAFHIMHDLPFSEEYHAERRIVDEVKRRLAL